jgi:hypothetical protein
MPEVSGLALARRMASEAFVLRPFSHLPDTGDAPRAG